MANSVYYRTLHLVEVGCLEVKVTLFNVATLAVISAKINPNSCIRKKQARRITW